MVTLQIEEVRDFLAESKTDRAAVHLRVGRQRVDDHAEGAVEHAQRQPLLQDRMNVAHEGDAADSGHHLRGAVFNTEPPALSGAKLAGVHLCGELLFAFAFAAARCCPLSYEVTVPFAAVKRDVQPDTVEPRFELSPLARAWANLAYERRGLEIESLDAHFDDAPGDLANDIEEVTGLECARLVRAAGEMGAVIHQANRMVGIERHRHLLTAE